MKHRGYPLPAALLGLALSCGGRAIEATSSGSDGAAGVGAAETGSSSSGASSSSNGAGPDGSGSSSGASGSGSAGSQVAPSCSPGGPGLTDCGSESESCCTSDEVPASTYYRTYANSGSGATGEADPATISGFRLDKYLVTVGRFRQFVAAVLPAGNAAGWLPAAGSGKHTYLNGGNGLLVGASADAGVSYETGWVASDDTSIAPTDANLDCDIAGTFMSSPVVESTWTPAAGDNENLPINCINWQEAYAFCIWDGGFLPSEAEWESAAADGSEQRGYPWGSADPGMANRYAIYANYYPAGGAANMDNIAPVGTATLGAGKYGQLDLAGNVWEWALDQYRDSYVDPCTDCAFLPVGSSADAPRIDRGGDFGSDSSQLIASYRNSVPSIARDVFVGVRCARAP